MGEYLTDVWELEAGQEQLATEHLDVICGMALAGNIPARTFLRGIWDGEHWTSIKEKLQVEGSVWYVWYMDGVRVLLSRTK